MIGVKEENGAINKLPNQIIERITILLIIQNFSHMSVFSPL